MLLGIWITLAVGFFGSALFFHLREGSDFGITVVLFAFTTTGFFLSIVPLSGYFRIIKHKKGGAELVYAPCALGVFMIVPPLLQAGSLRFGGLGLVVTAFLLLNAVVGWQAKER